LRIGFWNPFDFLGVATKGERPTSLRERPCQRATKDAKLVVYEGAPHGMCTTLKDRVNDELLEFIKT
jgi:hypothetical protein